MTLFDDAETQKIAPVTTCDYCSNPARWAVGTGYPHHRPARFCNDCVPKWVKCLHATGSTLVWKEYGGEENV